MNSEKRCLNTCQIFLGGDKIHQKNCPFYPESLTRIMDKKDEIIRDQNSEIEKLKTLPVIPFKIREQEKEIENLMKLLHYNFWGKQKLEKENAELRKKVTGKQSWINIREKTLEDSRTEYRELSSKIRKLGILIHEYNIDERRFDDVHPLATSLIERLTEIIQEIK